MTSFDIYIYIYIAKFPSRNLDPIYDAAFLYLYWPLVVFLLLKLNQAGAQSMPLIIYLKLDHYFLP